MQIKSNIDLSKFRTPVNYVSVFVDHSNGVDFNSFEFLSSALSDLELPCIDSLILSCQVKEDDSDTLLEDLLLMWKALEELVKKGRITSIGISDVGTETFINLYNAAEVRKLDYSIFGSMNQGCSIRKLMNDLTSD